LKCSAFEGLIEPPDGLPVRTEPAHQELYTTISKARCEFPRILEAYDAVQRYGAAHGLEMTAPPREVYFVDVNAVGPDDPFVDIAWPMAALATAATVQPA
jgi:effector-binding domain-containing protein